MKILVIMKVYLAAISSANSVFSTVETDADTDVLFTVLSIIDSTVTLNASLPGIPNMVCYHGDMMF